MPATLLLMAGVHHQYNPYTTRSCVTVAVYSLRTQFNGRTHCSNAVGQHYGTHPSLATLLLIIFTIAGRQHANRRALAACSARNSGNWHGMSAPAGARSLVRACTRHCDGVAEAGCLQVNGQLADWMRGVVRAHASRWRLLQCASQLVHLVMPSRRR